VEFGFLLKKFISFFLDPFGMVSILFIIGIYFLYKSKYNKAKLFLLSSFSLLYLFSYPPFANLLAQNLENQYPKYEYNKNVKYIHVLGNGHNTDVSQPISSHLNATSTKRVLEGIILHKKIANSKIIFTGYSGDTNTSSAEMNSILAITLGVNSEDIILGSKPLDTREEALFTKSLLGDEPFILVTSATHIPRAMMIFESLGMHPIAAPTNYYKDEFSGYLRRPDVNTLYISTVCMHEYFGMVLSKVRSLF
jgi:uncharacterized SAM-binding protein YcdF (DUF218 family)